jgi:hypothetical protein
MAILLITLIDTECCGMCCGYISTKFPGAHFDLSEMTELFICSAHHMLIQHIVREIQHATLDNCAAFAALTS